jgi:biotin carboxylase
VSVLILHYRGSLAATRYDEWLSGYDGEVILLCSREGLEAAGEELPAAGHGYAHVEAVTGYEFGGELESRALALAREHGVRYIIACQERDIERAAQLREILGLPGQTLASALPFRDKVLMKETVRKAGVATAEYRCIECAVDVVSFADVHGFPLVVKPRDGTGSFGVRILRTQADLERFLADEFEPYGPTVPNLMVEEFVSDVMCHVDGLIVDDRVIYAWPSRYMYALAVFEGDTAGRLDVTLDADDPLNARLVELTDRTLDSLDCPRSFAFHAEIFHTHDDRLVLGEIACRTGGAAQRDIQRTLFGADPTESWVRAQVGLPIPFSEDATRLQPASLTGQLGLLKRPGTVTAVPERTPFPWVVKQDVFVQPGEEMRPAAFAADFLALFVVSAPTREVSIKRMKELEAWFLNELALS